MKKIETFGLLFFCILHGVWAQPLTVNRVKENTYTIQFSSFSRKNKLTWSKFSDNWNAATPIAAAAKSDTLILASAHPIFRLTTGRKLYYAAPREVVLEGAVNFRDLGGYPTKDGRQIRWGKIYRSADISKLTGKDLDILISLHIKMVCDFRGEREAESAPDKIPDGTRRILLPAGSENIGGQGSFMKYMKNLRSADSLILSMYARTDHLVSKYKPFFDELLELKADQALMFHCTAGKDRTGVGAALILYALGVDEETIFQDYEATNNYRRSVNEKAIKGMVDMGLSEQAARSMMAAKREYLQTAFDAIKKNFGSMDAFLTDQIGLTPAKIQTLKSKFLY